MKNSLLLTLSFFLIFTSCDKRKNKFKGTWMAYKVENMQLENITGQYKGMEISDLRGNGQKIDSFLKLEENRLFCFENDNALLDDSDVFGQNIGSWDILDNKQLIVKSARGTEKFDIIKVKSKAIVVKKQFERSKDSILYTLVPFQNDKSEEMKECFKYLMSKSSQPENDEQIKTRLRNVLKFYSLYFTVISDDAQVNSFRPTRIYLPIKYYSGGIGIKDFDPKEDWVFLFNNTEDAAKAYQYLVLSLKKVGVFPNKGGRFALEYAEVFKEMSENI